MSAVRLADVTVRVPIVCELVDGQKVLCDELSASIDGPSDVKSLALKPTPGSPSNSSRAELSFVTAIAGTYIVRVRHGEDGPFLNQMPVVVNVHREGEAPPPPSSSASTNDDTAAAAGEDGDEEPIGRLIRFKIAGQASLGIESLSVQLVEGPAPINGAQVEPQGADLSVLLTLTAPGTYRVGVLHKGSPLPQSPFTITVPAKAFQ